MIRRRGENGLLLVTQEDHARLAGRIAARWGNRRYAAPEPHEHVVSAVTRHDAGWSLHDGRPTLNGDHQPAAFYELPPETSVRMWVASVSAAAGCAGAMGGLLVSWHFSGLARHIPIEEQSEPVENLLRDFMCVQQARRRDYCGTLGLSAGLAETPEAPMTEDDRKAVYNFSVLRTCDWLSLYLCAGELPDCMMAARETLLPDEGGALNVQWLDEQTLGISPWLLKGHGLWLDVPGRFVPHGCYRSDADLRRVYGQADAAVLRLRLVPL